MTLLDIIFTNLITVFILAGFIVLLKSGDAFDKKVQTLLNIGAISVSILVTVDMLDYYFELQDTVNNLRYITSAAGYTLRLVALTIFITVLLRKEDNMLLLWIPVILLAIISFTSYFTHIMFYFDSSNQFVRGTLGLLPHLMSFIYMGLLIYYAVRRFKITDIGEIYTILYIVIVCTVAIIVESGMGIKFLVSGAAISSCIVYYTYLYAQVYKIDPLTKAFNRTCFDKDIQKKSHKEIAIINIDLDNLKYINDTGGHDAGDKALCRLVNILKRESKNNYRIYRIGGDEFCVLGIEKNSVEINKFIKNAISTLRYYKLTASFGYAFYKPGDDFSDRCIEADEVMYENKKNKPIYTKK